MATVDICLIVGTRRWARIMAAELCAVLPDTTAIYLLGDPAEVELQEWLASSGLGTRIRVVAVMPPCPISTTGLAFIVNSAYLHRTAIEDALAAGYNVVSEKPMSFSRQETLSLLEKADSLGLRLFCTNTYLFATYLDHFRKNWLTKRRFTRMHICWEDPAREIRYGETKGYDSSVPLICDVLPHIANIILSMIGVSKLAPISIQVKRGGSEASLHYRHEDLDIHINVARNASQRVRSLSFADEDSEVLLDFSSEPGLVSTERQAATLIDPEWLRKPKPIAAMLHSVMEFFESGEQDERLTSSAALFANDMIDGVVDSYVTQQMALLCSKSNLTVNKADYDYACKESRSIAARALPFIRKDSPLQQLAKAASSLTPHPL